MFELFKLIWDVVVLRDVSRKGRYNWRIWPIGFGFVMQRTLLSSVIVRGLWSESRVTRV